MPKEIWVCDLFTVRTIWFRTLVVFFIILHGTLVIVHARVPVVEQFERADKQIVAESVLGGLHHVYRFAA